MAARNKPAVTAEGFAQSPNVDVHLALDMEELCSTAAPAAAKPGTLVEPQATTTGTPVSNVTATIERALRSAGLMR